MNNKRTIAINTVAQFIGKIISIIFNLLIVYLLTNNYPISYGDYATIFAFLFNLNVVADLGLATIMARDLHEQSTQSRAEFIGNAIIIRIVSLIIILVFANIIAKYLYYGHNEIIMGIEVGSISTFFLLISMQLFSIFQYHLKMYKAVIPNAIAMTINLLLVILFIKENFEIYYSVMAVSISYSIMFLITIFQVVQLENISFKINKELLFKIMKQCITVGGVILFSSIYFKSDSLILSIIKKNDTSQIAIYSIPYKILEVLIAIPQMFMAPVFTIMAKQLKENNLISFKDTFQKAVNFLIIIGLPIIPGALFLSNKIILSYTNSHYYNSIDVLKILSIAAFLSFFGSTFIFVLLVLKKQKYLLIWNIFLSIFNISLNIILIPRFSYIASAWITVLTELLVFVGSYFITKHLIKYVPNFSIILKILPSLALFTIILYCFYYFNINFYFDFALIPIFTMSIYIFSLILLKVITIDTIKEVLGKK